MPTKKCSNCSHTRVCWLRLKMNDVAIEAQKRAVVSWMEIDAVAQGCKHFAEVG